VGVMGVGVEEEMKGRNYVECLFGDRDFFFLVLESIKVSLG
jgi:hypothetical protein